MTRPSDPLLKLIRDLAQRRGLNTAAMAKLAGLDRARLKKVLAGQSSMTVDELIQLSEALELDAQALAQLSQSAHTNPDSDTPSDPSMPTALPQPSTAESPESSWVDPYGNHAEQALRMAFELGCDIFCHLDSSLIQDSGIPSAVLSRFPDFLPLRLEAAYHRHNHPDFQPKGLQLQLSFDSLYTCLLPWACFQQITLFPVRWEPSDEEDKREVAETAPQGAVPHLRLVD